MPRELMLVGTGVDEGHGGEHTRSLPMYATGYPAGARVLDTREETYRIRFNDKYFRVMPTT